METKQTAVQWLYDELSQCMHREEVCDLVYKLEQKAKQMEREQTLDFTRNAVRKILDEDRQNPFNLEQYYNETY
jgi:hypothetical protein